MFQRILAWIREVLNKMFGQSSIKQAFHVDIAVSADMSNALQLWAQMYNNTAPWVKNEITSLNLPASIAAEIARAVTIEMSVEISGSPRADYLAEEFDHVMDALRDQIEKGCAKGGMVMKPYAVGQEIHVDFIQADMFYPVKFDGNGNITACVFADQRTVGMDYFTRLEYHEMTMQGCIIRNLAFKSSTCDQIGNQVSLTVIPDWAELQPEALIANVDRPLFAYFRYPQANNIDPTSPLGVSCFSRAVELIEQADQQWSDFLWEFESARRALYVDVVAFDKDKNGKPILPNRRLYRTISQTSDVGDGELFKEWTPNIREQNILNGLDAILRRIEFSCGLAYGTLSNPATVDKTATELKISNQRSYATITDTQKALQVALDQLLYAIDVWATLLSLAPKGAYAAVYDFDDSIIVDKDAQFQQDMRLVTGGLMSKWEFRMRNFGEDEEIAKQKIADAQAEQQPQVGSFFQGA